MTFSVNENFDKSIFLLKNFLILFFYWLFYMLFVFTFTYLNNHSLCFLYPFPGDTWTYVMTKVMMENKLIREKWFPKFIIIYNLKYFFILKLIKFLLTKRIILWMKAFIFWIEVYIFWINIQLFWIKVHIFWKYVNIFWIKVLIFWIKVLIF